VTDQPGWRPTRAALTGLEPSLRAGLPSEPAM
jgi:hypothetical protein